MGNRAVITTKENFDNDGVGVYLHWNGGRDSVEAFLAFCNAKGYRTPDSDCYGWAYLVTTLGNFFGDGLSLGVDKVSNLDCDNWDNGVYIIDGWDIVDRKYAPSHEQYNHDLEEMLQQINSKQPESMRLNDDEISQAVVRAGASVALDKFFTSLEVNDNG